MGAWTISVWGCLRGKVDRTYADNFNQSSSHAVNSRVEGNVIVTEPRTVFSNAGLVRRSILHRQSRSQPEGKYALNVGIVGPNPSGARQVSLRCPLQRCHREDQISQIVCNMRLGAVPRAL